MSRSCGECTLCCKLERITELAKQRNKWCSHCTVGIGCAAYKDRPPSCQNFRCWWLDNDHLGDDLRPDKIGAYASGDPKAGYLRVMLDADAPIFPSHRRRRLIDAIKAAGLHAIVNEGDSVTFVQGNAPRPQRIMLDWIL